MTTDRAELIERIIEGACGILDRDVDEDVANVAEDITYAAQALESDLTRQTRRRRARRRHDVPWRDAPSTR